MRLIDADELIEKLNKNSIFKKITNVEGKNIYEIIDEQPTAYDIDNVVEELENEKSIHTENYNISLYKDYPEIKQRYENVCGVIDKAIKIVKQGGADDVCEYEYHVAPSKDIYFLTSCGRRHNGRLDTCLPYCGFCGKKIKVVE